MKNKKIQFILTIILICILVMPIGCSKISTNTSKYDKTLEYKEFSDLQIGLKIPIKWNYADLNRNRSEKDRMLNQNNILYYWLPSYFPRFNILIINNDDLSITDGNINEAIIKQNIAYIKKTVSDESVDIDNTLTEINNGYLFEYRFKVNNILPQYKSRDIFCKSWNIVLDEKSVILDMCNDQDLWEPLGEMFEEIILSFEEMK